MISHLPRMFRQAQTKLSFQPVSTRALSTHLQKAGATKQIIDLLSEKLETGLIKPIKLKQDELPKHTSNLSILYPELSKKELTEAYDGAMNQYMVQHIAQNLCVNKHISQISLKVKRDALESYLSSYNYDLSKVHDQLEYISDDQIAAHAIKNIQLFYPSPDEFIFQEPLLRDIDTPLTYHEFTYLNHKLIVAELYRNLYHKVVKCIEQPLSIHNCYFGIQDEQLDQYSLVAFLPFFLLTQGLPIPLVDQLSCHEKQSHTPRTLIQKFSNKLRVAPISIEDVPDYIKDHLLIHSPRLIVLNGYKTAATQLLK